MPKSQTSSPQATRNDTIVAHASCRVDLAGSTLDLWPLYLFHPGAVTVNFAVNILTRCQITPSADQAIHFKSIDTGREDHFRNFDEFCRAKATKHHLAEHLVRFFLPEGPRNGRGFTLETNSESPAGAAVITTTGTACCVPASANRRRRGLSRVTSGGEEESAGKALEVEPRAEQISRTANASACRAPERLLVMSAPPGLLVEILQFAYAKPRQRLGQSAT